MGATFDPSALYRFNAVQRMLRENGLTTARISAQVARLQKLLFEQLPDTALEEAELLNPPGAGPQARFLAFRHPRAEHWHAALQARDCITDVRGNVLRIGFGVYQDEADVQRLLQLLQDL